jgi:hypothetical protein
MLTYSKGLFAIILSIFFFTPAFSQTNAKEVKEAILLQKGVGSLKNGDTLTAYQYFQTIYAVTSDNNDANYYYLMLSLALNKPYAETLTNKWLAESNNRIYNSRLNYYLGKFYFRKQLASPALSAYSKVSIDDLSNEEIGLMKFEQAYFYFKNGDWENAVNLLNNVRQIKGQTYYYDANYYAGFIALQQKNFPLAMTCFKIASQSTSYNTLTPFYISQLHYLMGDIEAAIVNCESA